MSRPLPIVVLISGGGTNLQAIIDGAADGSLPVEIRAVISSQGDAYGLERARRAGIPVAVLEKQSHPERADYDRALMALIDSFEPELLVLAGFMRILTPEFVTHYADRIMNIHPALLPKFRGLHTHERAIAAGEREHGASVHFVTPDLDAGPLIVQATVPVLAGDTPEVLAARVLQQEHQIYPLAIRWFAEGRLAVNGGEVHLDGRPLGPQGFDYRAPQPQEARPAC